MRTKIALIIILASLVSCQTNNKKNSSNLALGQAAPITLSSQAYLSDIRQLTYVGARSGEGYFSKDGQQLVFQSEREKGNPFYQIYLMDLKTNQVKRISSGFGKTTCAWIHPDGKKILFSSTHLDSKARQKQKDELKFRASGQQRRYQWDYDENYDLFVSHEGQLKRITTDVGYDAEGSFSPDGQWITFASNRAAYKGSMSDEDKKMFTMNPSHMMDIYIMRADGSQVRQLTTMKGYDGGPFFSPDGKRITWRHFSEDGRSAEVYTMNVDGSDVKQLTHLKAMSWAPFYHPSGDYLIFTTSVNGHHNFELYVVDVNGEKEPVRVTDLEGFDGLPVFTPDGKSLVWSRKAFNSDSQIFISNWNDELIRQKLNLKLNKPALNELIPALSSDDSKKIVGYLASESLQGRGTGSENEVEYMGWIEAMFKGMGLSPYGESYSYKTKFLSHVELGSTNSLNMETWTKQPALNEEWLPLGFSKTGDFSSKEIVFAGYGLVAPAYDVFKAYNSYEGLDVKNKWVMIFRYIPEEVAAKWRAHLQRYSRIEHKIMMARERGAAGVIIVTGPTAAAKSDIIPLKFDRASSQLSLPVLSISNSLAQKFLQKHELKSLQKEFDSAKKVTGFSLAGLKLSAQIDLKFKEAEARSVVGVIKVPGSTKTVFIGAHGDHLGKGYSEASLSKLDAKDQIHYGADDNASGVTGVLELAHYFSKPENRVGLKQNLAFAIWSGEELGNLGSSAFIQAERAKQKLKNISAYLNMDMIGRYQKKVDIQGLGSSPDWMNLLEEVSLNAKIFSEGQTDPYLPTDSLAFYMAEIPAINFFTGAHVDYHTPGDTFDKINYEGLIGAAELVGDLAKAIARRDKAISYNKVDTKDMKGLGGGRKFRIYLGTIPDYSQENTKGVKISGVIKGGPAEKAGLAGGDIIVQLSEFKIESIHDYVYSLEAIRPGQETKIVVMRGSKKIDLNIVPSARE